MLRTGLLTAGLVLAFPVAGMASTTTLTFDDLIILDGPNEGNPLGDGGQLDNQDFSTGDVTISQGVYDGPLGEAGANAPRNVGDELMRFWTDWSGVLENVAYVDPGPEGGSMVGEFVFSPNFGSQVTIDSFQMAGFGGAAQPITVSIFEVSDNSWSSPALWSESTTIDQSRTFSPDVTSTSELRLQWTLSGEEGDIDFVAIDNITFTSSNGDPSVIPLPATLPLLLGGLGLFGFLAARRRTGAA